MIYFLIELQVLDMLYVLSVIWLVSTTLSFCPGHSSYCSNHFVPKCHGKLAITHGIQFSAGNDQGYPTTVFCKISVRRSTWLESIFYYLRTAKKC